MIANSSFLIGTKRRAGRVTATQRAAAAMAHGHPRLAPLRPGRLVNPLYRKNNLGKRDADGDNAATSTLSSVLMKSANSIVAHSMPLAETSLPLRVGEVSFIR
ncbi:MAG: hypothetical protein PHH47_01565 [Gallionella sp.]|nr:hypothetical protein [Gallionella sp.]MDD4946733.1 hypothetical protein [Gallionella sp.]